MPLDTTQLDVARLESIPGFQSAFTFSSGGLLPLTETDAQSDLAEDALALWAAAQAIEGADLLIVRFAAKQAIVSKRAGLVSIGEKSFNAGFLRQVVKGKPAQDLADVDALSDSQWSAAQKMIWALAHRFGRVEAPRVFEMMLGDYEYVIEIDKNGFAIVDEDGGATRFVEKISMAAAAGNSVEYTMGSPRQRDRRSVHTISEIFGHSETGTWTHDAGGWPLGVPAQAPFDAIRSATWLATSIATRANAVERLDVLSEAGQRIISSSNHSDHIAIDWRRDEPEGS